MRSHAGARNLCCCACAGRGFLDQGQDILGLDIEVGSLAQVEARTFECNVMEVIVSPTVRLFFTADAGDGHCFAGGMERGVEGQLGPTGRPRAKPAS